MAQPNIKAILPIDAKIGGEISATYSGDTPFSNRLIIYLASNLSVVYNNVTSTHDLSHKIPTGVLKNGERYAATIQFFDENGVASTVSDKKYFLALETPTFKLKDIYNDMTVKNSEIELTILYSQSNGESLSNFQFYLYTADHRLLGTSDIMYDDLVNAKYVFRGLDNRTTYYVQAKGTTEHGLSCDSGTFKIFTDYQNPSTFSRIYAESDINGTVNGYINVLLISPVDDDISHYIFDNGFINLRDNRIIEYNEGYDLSGDFLICFKFRAAMPNTDMLIMKNTDNEIFKISNIIYNDKMIYKLTASNGISNYILYSDKYTYNDNTKYTMWIKRINNVYQMIIYTS